MPERPAVQPEYPAVHDMPPPRTDSTLSEDEKKRLKDELIASREYLQSIIQDLEAPGGVTQKAAATTKAGTTKKPDSAATGGTQPAGVARDP